MTNWFYATSGTRESVVQPPTVIDPANTAKWEQAIRDAIDVQGPLAVSDWNDFRDTDVWSGGSVGSIITMYDGVRAFLQAYFYFGCTDSAYLTYAYAVANIQWKWMEQGGLTQGEVGNPTGNFYRPATFVFYPDGLTTLHKLDPTFTGGGVDDDIWLTGSGQNIPEFFDLVVNNCQLGESHGSLTIDTEFNSREVALTVMYYLDSLRVGNTLPVTSRFDDLVAAMKIHMRQWIDDGPSLFGVDSITYQEDYNDSGITNPAVGSPALLNLSPWYMNITAEAMLRTFEEHPSYSTDTELTYWVERMADWLILYAREEEWPGTYWPRAVNCRDCSDPIVQDAGSPTTQWCIDNGSGGFRDCWHRIIPRSQNPEPENEKQYQITTPMVWCAFSWLYDTTGKQKWSDELDEIFNVMTPIYDIEGALSFGRGKQLNQMTRFWYDLQRVRVNSGIYTTFHDPALPCT